MGGRWAMEWCFHNLSVTPCFLDIKLGTGSPGPALPQPELKWEVAGSWRVLHPECLQGPECELRYLKQTNWRWFVLFQSVGMSGYNFQCLLKKLLRAHKIPEKMGFPWFSQGEACPLEGQVTYAWSVNYQFIQKSGLRPSAQWRPL